MVNKPRKRHAQQPPAVDKSAEPAPQTPGLPLDLGTLPLDSLREYRDHYSLNIKEPMTLKGYMLGGSMGEQTWSAQHLERSPPRDVAEASRAHFSMATVREGDAIAEFLYAVQHKDEEFKLRF